MQERQGVTMATSKQEHSLLQILQERFTSLENVRTLAIDYDRELLSFLLESSEFRERFFTRVDSVVVFEKDKFLDFLKLRVLSKSYTVNGNKIGLQLESSFESLPKVVLNFPFKDCVLKGAQSRDEQKSKEIFFNEVLARSEIDILFSPKALQNFELIGQGDLKENLNNANLIIKGNNLLALHSLKKKFANKVKLIYIDPPYNTGNDSFNYNDNFNHSTWLTFMKNRLEIAKEFLRDDGVIFISMTNSRVGKDTEKGSSDFAYLWILCDEIFGRDNLICNFTYRQFHSVKNDAKNVSINTENILCYAKKYSKDLIKNEFYDKTADYKYNDNDGKGKYKLDPLHAKSGGESGLYCYTFKNGVIWEAPKGTYPRFSIETLRQMENDDEIFWTTKNKPMMKRYLNRVQEGKKTSSYWDGIEVGFSKNGDNEIKLLFGEKIFKNPKPEALIKRIIEISTNENDLVMDFFAGSGTTLAVAMKMKRQFIGIEQMDYIESITKERLKKVINGEQGGISKAVDWQGGGSFIYAELMPLNAVYKEKLLSLRGEAQAFHNQKVDSSVDCHEVVPTSRNDKTEKELEKIYNDLESKAFVDYRVDIQDMLKDKEFHALSLDEKLKVLYAILDSNMDYVLYDDIEDSEYGVSKELKELNRIFYGDNDE